MQKKLNKKLNCSSLSVFFNETCLNEGLLPKYRILYIYISNVIHKTIRMYIHEYTLKVYEYMIYIFDKI